MPRQDNICVENTLYMNNIENSNVSKLIAHINVTMQTVAFFTC